MKAFAMAYEKKLQLEAAGGIAQKGKKRANKYGAKKTIIGKFTFDSKIEAEFYSRLYLLLKYGVIQSLELQPKFLLQDGFEAGGDTPHLPIYYIADFKVCFPDGTIKIYDTKGKKTQEYRIKKKLFLFQNRETLFEEVYSASEHPVRPTPLSKDEVKAIKKQATLKANIWKAKFVR